MDYSIDRNSDKQIKLRRFYHFAYDQYCRSGYRNDWFYPFCLEDFDANYLKNECFKYSWLLQIVENHQQNNNNNNNSRHQHFAKFKRIPSDIQNGRSLEGDHEFREELNDFKDKFRSKLIRA